MSRKCLGWIWSKIENRRAWDTNLLPCLVRKTEFLSHREIFSIFSAFALLVVNFSSDELRNIQTNKCKQWSRWGRERNGHSNNESAMTNPPTHTGHLMPSVKFLLFHHVLSVGPLELYGQPDLFFEYLAMMSRGMKFCEICKCRNVLFYFKILRSTHSERWCNG